MERIATYRGRNVTDDDVAVINGMIAAHPDGSRRFISQQVCRAWNWRQPNGRLKDMVCRSLLLLLQSQGWIQLPPAKCKLSNPLANRKGPAPIAIDQRPISCCLNDVVPIRMEQVRRTPKEKLCNSLISQHHYLGYTQPVGEHLKYMAFSQGRPIACLVWSSAPWHIGVRDRFIGWSATARKKNLHLIACQNRFLILPWVQVPHIASYLLALNRGCLSTDWERIYAHPVHLLETFVETGRFKGTCYKADNWVCIGQTTGRGKPGMSTKTVLPRKAVYLYPLRKDFRQRLCQEAAQC